MLRSRFWAVKRPPLSACTVQYVLRYVAPGSGGDRGAPRGRVSCRRARAGRAGADGGKLTRTMLSPEVGRYAFRWAMFIVLVAVGLLATLRPGTPEFAITLLTLLIGVLFLGILVVCIRLIGR